MTDVRQLCRRDFFRGRGALLLAALLVVGIAVTQSVWANGKDRSKISSSGERHPLARLREDRHWTRKELAARAGVNSVTISQIERGRSNPTPASQAKILGALGLEMDASTSVFGDRPASNQGRDHSLVQLRKARHWTQQDLARLAGVNTQTVSRIENGLYYPKPTTQARILNVLGLNTDASTSVFGDRPGSDARHPLAQLRQDSQLTQQGLATLAGVGLQTIVATESRLHYPGPKTRMKVLAALGLNESDSRRIFGDRPAPRRNAGHHLVQVRRDQHLTQQRLATLAGVSLRAITEIENGLFYPRPTTRAKILEALGLSRADSIRIFGEPPSLRRSNESSPLVQVRQDSHLTQKDLAALAGVSQQAIAAIESGRYYPKPPTQAKILNALGRDASDSIRIFGDAPVAFKRRSSPAP